MNRSIYCLSVLSTTNKGTMNWQLTCKNITEHGGVIKKKLTILVNLCKTNLQTT